MNRRIFLVIVIVLVVGGILFYPTSSLRRSWDVRRIDKNSLAIQNRIDTISKRGSDFSSIDSLNSQLEKLEEDLENFRDRTLKFVDRHSVFYIKDYILNFMYDLARFDKLFVITLAPYAKERGFSLDNPFPQNSEFLANILGSSDFSEYFINLAENNDYILGEFRLAEIVDAIQIKTIGSSSGWSGYGTIQPFAKLKEDFLLTFAGRLEGAASTTLARAGTHIVDTPGDLIRRLALFDEVRENVFDSETKTQLNIVRQKLLYRVGNNIEAEVAERALSEAKGTVEKLEQEISIREGAVSNRTTQALERARFHLDQAGAFKEKQNHESSFGQATAAAVAARNVLLPLIVDIQEYKNDIETIKKRFDQLMKVVSEISVIPEELDKKIKETEERILTVSRLTETESESSKTFSALTNLKILIGVINQEVTEIISRSQRAP
jgi:hypothetical protein